SRACMSTSDGQQRATVGHASPQLRGRHTSRSDEVRNGGAAAHCAVGAPPGARAGGGRGRKGVAQPSALDERPRGEEEALRPVGADGVLAISRTRWCDQMLKPLRRLRTRILEYWREAFTSWLVAYWRSAWR